MWGDEPYKMFHQVSSTHLRACISLPGHSTLTPCEQKCRISHTTKQSVWFGITSRPAANHHVLSFLKMNQWVFKYWNHWFWLLLVCCSSLSKVCFGGPSYILTNRSSWNSTSLSRKTLLLGCMDAKAYRRHTHRLVSQTRVCSCSFIGTAQASLKGVYKEWTFTKPISQKLKALSGMLPFMLILC